MRAPNTSLLDIASPWLVRCGRPHINALTAHGSVLGLINDEFQTTLQDYLCGTDNVCIPKGRQSVKQSRTSTLRFNTDASCPFPSATSTLLLPESMSLKRLRLLQGRSLGRVANSLSDLNPLSVATLVAHNISVYVLANCKLFVLLLRMLEMWV